MLQATACAKLNLYLHVTGKRPDGYHLLESLVAFTEAGDTIRVEAADWLTLEAFGAFASQLPRKIEENLIMQTARLLQKHAGTRRGAKITLEKNLPVSSGIGGGSTDAATAARLLCDLWRLSYSQEGMAEMLLPLGADIPVCLHQRTAVIRGIGEEIRIIPALPPMSLVLVNPGGALATKEVYAKSSELSDTRLFSSPLEGERANKERSDAGSRGGITPHASTFALRARSQPLPLKGGAIGKEFSGLPSFISFLQQTTNHLQPAAIALMPEIRRVLEILTEMNGCLLARMSGSGATCFGIFDTKEKAAEAAERVKRLYPAAWVMATDIIS